MSNALNLFDSRRSDWCIPGTGKLTTEAQRFVRDLWLRVGGATATSANDLALLGAFEAGGAESAEMRRAFDGLAAGAEFEASPAEIAELRKQVEGLALLIASQTDSTAQATVLRNEIEGLAILGAFV